MDLTSYDFMTQDCGACHPGGGPAELDRNGKRYDLHAADPANNIKGGADNGFDGDYYKAKWAESGVIEADCLLCHLPGYDKKSREAQRANLNYRWAASAGAGFAKITGAVKNGENLCIQYDKARFDEKGCLKHQIAPEPGTSVCLWCHGETDWKKKGEVYEPRKDVHLNAGLRCVDCHPAGSRAADERINKPGMHQFAKGDDPGSLVRDDLDDTMEGCQGCHETRKHGAPLPKHAGLPPDHLETISCQACHIPWRYGQSVLVHDSTADNPLPRHPATGKKIWTFYGQNLRPWNFYGEKDFFGAQNQPTDRFRPQLARYKGKIYPVNRVYSLWVGIEEQGKPLDMVWMQDLRGMWASFEKDPASFPELQKLKDDNGDGVTEINSPEEIEAIIKSVTAWLESKKKPMDGKGIVFVDGTKVHRSGTESYEVEALPHEYTPYASSFKYSHGVQPAGAALGSGGCTDCHSGGSHFFFQAVMQRPFGADAKLQWQAQYELLGISGSMAELGAFREETLKPASFFLTLLAGAMALIWVLSELILTAGFFGSTAGASTPAAVPGRLRAVQGVILMALLLSVVALFSNAAMLEYVTVSQRFLNSTHAAFAGLSLLLAMAAMSRIGVFRGKSGGVLVLDPVIRVILAAGILAIAIGGGTMFLKSGFRVVFPFAGWVRFSYTLFDAGVFAALSGIVLFLGRATWLLPVKLAAAPQADSNKETTI